MKNLTEKQRQCLYLLLAHGHLTRGYSVTGWTWKGRAPKERTIKAPTVRSMVAKGLARVDGDLKWGPCHRKLPVLRPTEKGLALAMRMMRLVECPRCRASHWVANPNHGRWGLCQRCQS